MRTLSKTIVALGLVALMAGPALAQQGRGGGGGRGFGGGGIGMLLGNASVQQELKLDATQIEKAKELSAKIREKMTAATQGLEGQERFAKMREISKEINTEANTAVKEFLKPEQIHRLHQIQHQVQGAQAFTDEHVQKHLKLTDAQKTDIEAIVAGVERGDAGALPEHAERSRGHHGQDRRAPQGDPRQDRSQADRRAEDHLEGNARRSVRDQVRAPSRRRRTLSTIAL